MLLMLYLLRAAFKDGRIVSVEALMVLLRSGATSPHASTVTWMPLSSAALFVLVVFLLNLLFLHSWRTFQLK